MNNSNDKKKKFKLFDPNRDGKGVYEVESRKPTLGFFFKLFFRKFSQLLKLNLMMLFMVLPVLIFICIYFLGNKTPTATAVTFAPLYGISTVANIPGASNLLDLSSIQMEIPAFTPLTNVIIIVLFLFMAVTWGWQNVGSAYVLRGLFRGDAVFVFSDYMYGIKRNFKHAFFLGLIDFACTAMLIIDFMFFYSLTGSFKFDFMYFSTVAMVIIWIMMRFYIYNLLVTFNLKNFKIIKNSLIFSILGIKRNVLGLLGIALLIVFHIMLIILLLPYGLAAVLVIPFLYIIAAIGFIGTYCAFPVIQKYMIDPYDNDESEDAPTEDTDALTE